MIKLLLITSNKKEGDILSLAFQQKSFKVILSEPTYANYVKSLQYIPDLLLMEIPTVYTESLHFVRLLRKNKRLAKTPVLTYGNVSDPTTVKLLFLTGVNKYYVRPLRFGELINDLGVFLKGKGVSVAPKGEQDVQKRQEMITFLMDKEKVGSEKIDMMVQYIGKLLVFPFTVNRILKIADDLKSGAPELAKVIKTDSAMTTTILKVANSVLFASRDRKISEIREGVVRIGFKETKNIALSMSIMKLLDKEEKSLGYSRLEFWYHSLAVAVIAERFAKQAGIQSVEEVFVSGLLHDFGILLLDEFFPELFEPIMKQTTEKGGSFYDAVRSVIGISHNDVLEKLFDGWNIPKRITTAVLRQMDYATFKDETDIEQQKLVQIVGMANVIAKGMNLGRECDQIVNKLPNELLVQMRFPAGFRNNFFDEIHTGMNMYARFINLDGRTYPEGPVLEGNVAEFKIMIVNRSQAFFDSYLHYVKLLGYTIMAEEPLAGITEVDKLPNMIIINVDADTEISEIEEFTKSTIIPVILFTAENDKCNALQNSPIFKKLSPDIDLRIIDTAIENMIKVKA
ncbi:MAG: HDOD domain-containing protein [Fibrobacteres bacterium]|nr:HDOD domain-containing protein [Fibrobacterota bacterium]